MIYLYISIYITNYNFNVNTSFSIVLEKFEALLNVMAPIKKMTKRERRLQQRPWITKGILISMHTRDRMYKQITLTVDPLEKRILFNRFKRFRNLIVTLQRKSKSNYFSEYFEQHQNDIKKTWDGIRNILNVSKKKSSNIDLKPK